MSIEALTWSMNTTTGSASRKGVLNGYANHAHKDGRHAWPDQETIAHYAEVDERTVRRKLSELIERGFIRRGDQAQVAHVRGDRKPVVYDLAMNEETRLRWAAMAAAGDSSLDSEITGDPWWIATSNPANDEGTGCPPVQRSRPDTMPGRETDTGGHRVHHGGTPCPSRGGTVPGEPSVEPSVEPEEPSRRQLALVDVPRDDVERLCSYLADRIEVNGSKRPTIGQKWRDAARLMLDRDGRSEADVVRAIDWCQADDFWRSNILSMPKLREQYDRLRLAAQRQHAPQRGRRDIDWDAAFARAAARDAQGGHR